MAAALQLLMPGMPFIYYGDEYAMTGGDDPDCRRGMVWDEKYQDKEMFAWYQKLIQMRKQYPSITEGREAGRSCDDVNRVLMIERELGEEKARIIFDFENYKVEFKVERAGEVISEGMLDNKE